LALGRFTALFQRWMIITSWLQNLSLFRIEDSVVKVKVQLSVLIRWSHAPKEDATWNSILTSRRSTLTLIWTLEDKLLKGGALIPSFFECTCCPHDCNGGFVKVVRSCGA